MSTLVTVIVLAYLLVIAVCVAAWSALSTGRAEAPGHEDARQEAGRRHGEDRPARSGERPGRAPSRPATHDAYRGARARVAQGATLQHAAVDGSGTAAVDVYAPVRRPQVQERLFAVAERAAPAPTRADARPPRPDGGAERPEPESERPDPVRVTDARKARERADPGRDGGQEPERPESEGSAADGTRDERTAREDAFERFLRANEDFER